LLHHRLECGVAEELPLVIGHHADALHLEGIERVLDLAKGTINIWKRHGREHPEPARMVGNDLGAELVGLAGELSRGVEIAKEDTRLANGQYRGRHTSLVHIVDRLGYRPFIKGTWPVLRPEISAMNPGDERWWWTSMRKGLSTAASALAD